MILNQCRGINPPGSLSLSVSVTMWNTTSADAAGDVVEAIRSPKVTLAQMDPPFIPWFSLIADTMYCQVAAEAAMSRGKAALDEYFKELRH